MPYFYEMNRLLSICFLIIVFCTANASAQRGLSNNSSLISIKKGTYLSVIGNVQINGGGQFLNQDSLFITNDWINMSNKEAFIPAEQGFVFFRGNTQRIKGHQTTTFDNLVLSGDGIKYADLDIYARQQFILNDRELHVDTHTIYVLNHTPHAVTNVGQGFVSAQKEGGLSRNMTRKAWYIFPVGSSHPFKRYRPVSVRPISPNTNTFKVRMAHVSPSYEGYDIEKKDSTICFINPAFYHKIHHTNGLSHADISIYTNPLVDGSFTDIAQWSEKKQWNKTKKIESINQDNLTLMTVKEWNDFTPTPFALASTETKILQPDTSMICQGSTLKNIYLTAPEGKSYRWASGATSPKIHLQFDTKTVQMYTDTVWVKKNTTCYEQKTYVVIVSPKSKIRLSNDTTVCPGQEVSLHADGGDKYTWSTGNTNSSISLKVQKDQVIYVDIENNQGCVQRDSVQIKLHAGTSNHREESICEKETITLKAFGGKSYRWSTNDTRPELTLYNLKKGRHQFSVTIDNITCGITVDTIDVTVNETPLIQTTDDNITVGMGNTTILESTILSEDSTDIDIQWSPNTYLSCTNCLHPKASPPKTTMFYVTAQSKLGCISKDSIRVNVLSLDLVEIPNIITPNKDGFNETWNIPMLEHFPNNEMLILNRWGDIIYRKKGYINQFDGQYNTGTLPDGVYFYVLTFFDENNKAVQVRKGNLSIIR